MILGTHNSWSFRTPTKWWQRLIGWTARCQSRNIKEQYELGARDFDLRLKFVNGEARVVHNIIDYGSLPDVLDDLAWLNEQPDTHVRLIHDVRTDKDWSAANINSFCIAAQWLEEKFPNIVFWEGCNLYNYEVDYPFTYKPINYGCYSSARKPRYDDIFPRWFAKRNNHAFREQHPIDGDDSEVMEIDFIEYD